MLTISQAQIEAFAQVARLEYENRMVEYLKERFSLADEGLPRMVHEGIDQALGFNIISEGDVQRYLECLAQHGRGFPELPWSRSILTDIEDTGTQKMDRIQWYVLQSQGG